MDWVRYLSAHLGNFDPLKLRQIRHLTVTERLSPHGHRSAVELVVSALYWPDFLLTLRFSGVVSLSIPTIEGGGMIGFGELFIQDVSASGLESIRYTFVDNLTGFQCSCWAVEPLDLSRVNADETIERIATFDAVEGVT